jgi:opacity protein-like surface antigen
MINPWIKSSVSLFALALAASTANGMTNAASYNPFSEFDRRAGNGGDLYAYYHQVEGRTTFNSGTVVEDDGVIYGLGLSVHPSSYVSMHMEIGAGGLDSKYNTLPGVYDLWAFEMKLGLDYHVLKRRLTPVLSAGIGLMNQTIDELNVSEGSFTYGLGAGLRWDVTDHFFIKAGYVVDWTSFDSSSEPTKYDGLFAAVGWRF